MNRTILSELKELKAGIRAAAILLLVAGCGSSQSTDRAAVEIKGSDPARSAAAPAPATGVIDTAPNADGVINYDGYQAAAARSGDTVASVAQRIGLSASELGAYNGLAPTHPLRQGDELVLPPRPGGYGDAATTVPAAPQTNYEFVQGAPAISGTDVTPIEAAPLSTGTDLAPSAPSATPPSADEAWSLDLAAAAIDRASGFDEQGNLAAPPSAEEPLPPAPQAPVELASPDLKQYQTPSPDPVAPPPQRPVENIITPIEEPVLQSDTKVAVAAPAPAEPVKLQLIRPVRGPVVVGFNQGVGRAQNDGIDFASPANSSVVAAAGGEVALVSQSLGGLGNIVLIRHKGDYLTVYGRIERVTVRKGDIVSQGQKIGVVSPATQPRMHFEVRKGADSQDPMKFF